jgi:beta-phosphoglucomutase
MLRAVIFDFDGVIVDSEMLHLKAFNIVLAPYNKQITKEQYYKEMLGLSDADLFKTLVEKDFPVLHTNGGQETDDQKLAGLLEKKRVVFEGLARSECRPIGGVKAFLDILKLNMIPAAICSGALLNEIKIILDANQLTGYFDVIVSAEQVKRGKPFPDGFLLTLQKLNEKIRPKILPAHCVVIEDSQWGLIAAQKADMKTIAVTNSYDAEQLSFADKVTSTLAKISFKDLQKICR